MFRRFTLVVRSESISPEEHRALMRTPVYARNAAQEMNGEGRPEGIFVIAPYQFAARNRQDFITTFTALGEALWEEGEQFDLRQQAERDRGNARRPAPCGRPASTSCAPANSTRSTARR